MNQILIIIIVGFVFFVVGYLVAWVKVQEVKKEGIKQSRRVLGGEFSEQLAPYLPNFPFSPTETKFIGKPIDLVVFKGMDQKNITEVIFVEVKSGKSRLNPNERILRNVIDDKKVSWQEYRVPEEITKIPEKSRAQ